MLTLSPSASERGRGRRTSLHVARVIGATGNKLTLARAELEAEETIQASGLYWIRVLE